MLETQVRLQPERAERLTEEVNDLFRWRQEGTPFNQPCCGSVFKNPAAAPAGPEGRAMTAGQPDRGRGAQGVRRSAAPRSPPMHANYIVNTGGGDRRGCPER